MQRNRITLANWQDPDHTQWSYRHVRELIPTARIARGEPASVLREAEASPAGLAVERLLDDDRTDGLIVVHRGEAVLEEYRGTCTPATFTCCSRCPNRSPGR